MVHRFCEKQGVQLGYFESEEFIIIFAIDRHKKARIILAFLCSNNPWNLVYFLLMLSDRCVE